MCVACRVTRVSLEASSCQAIVQARSLTFTTPPASVANHGNPRLFRFQGTVSRITASHVRRKLNLSEPLDRSPEISLEESEEVLTSTREYSRTVAARD